MKTILKRFPFMFYGVLGMLHEVSINLFHIAYDEGGVLSLYYFFGMLFKIPFNLVQELFFSLNGGRGFPGSYYLSILCGFILLAAGDYVLNKVKTERTTS